jgi:hypothetical protein
VEWFPTVEDACADLVALGDHVDPSAEAEAYREPYARYQSLYPALAPTFHSMD